MTKGLKMPGKQPCIWKAPWATMYSDDTYSTHALAIGLHGAMKMVMQISMCIELLVKMQCHTICFLAAKLHLNMQAGMLSNDVMQTSVILGSSEFFKRTADESARHHMHHRLMKQTQCNLQIVFNKQCLHMTSAGEGDRHHLIDAVHEKAIQRGWPSGDSRQSLSPYAEKIRSHEPNTLLSVGHSQLCEHRPYRLLYLGQVACIMNTYDGCYA